MVHFCKKILYSLYVRLIHLNSAKEEAERKIKTTTLNNQIIYILFVTRAIFCP